MKLKYNSPVVLTFSLLSLAALILGYLTGGASTVKYFAVYRAPLTDPLTYLRVFTHVLGHSGYTHYMSNMLILLLVGPSLEEKYGSRQLLIGIAATALITGVFHMIFFRTALMGASGVVFMMIVMASFSGFKQGTIPVTLVLILVLYVGSEIVDMFTHADNVSQSAHIVGGLWGLVWGWNLNQLPKPKRKSH
jgi:membrane associated rhomboid family serine protease